MSCTGVAVGPDGRFPTNEKVHDARRRPNHGTRLEGRSALSGTFGDVDRHVGGGISASVMMRSMMSEAWRCGKDGEAGMRG